MATDAIQVKTDPDPYEPYNIAQAYRAGDFVFVSGQGPLDPQTGKVVGETIEAQTARVLENIRNILEAGGASMAQVVKMRTQISGPHQTETAGSKADPAAVALSEVWIIAALF